MSRTRSVVLVILVVLGIAGVALRAQNPIQPLTDAPPAREALAPAPARAQGEGFGPYATMVIRGAMLIDGTGGPPRGPAPRRPVDRLSHERQLAQEHRGISGP